MDINRQKLTEQTETGRNLQSKQRQAETNRNKQQKAEFDRKKIETYRNGKKQTGKDIMDRNRHYGQKRPDMYKNG